MSRETDIERRAREMAGWNPTLTYDWALKTARAEAASGTLPDYSPIGIARRDVRDAQRDLAVAENANRYDAEFVSQMRDRLFSAKERLSAALDVAPISQAAE